MRFYFFALACAGAGAFYFIRRGVGDAECRARVAAQNADAAVAAQMVVIQKQRRADEAAVNTAVGDIRRILREKYTIAE